jgi:hypothetical protein
MKSEFFALRHLNKFAGNSFITFHFALERTRLITTLFLRLHEICFRHKTRQYSRIFFFLVSVSWEWKLYYEAADFIFYRLGKMSRFQLFVIHLSTFLKNMYNLSLSFFQIHSLNSSSMFLSIQQEQKIKTFGTIEIAF